MESKIALKCSLITVFTHARSCYLYGRVVVFCYLQGRGIELNIALMMMMFNIIFIIIISAMLNSIYFST